MIVYTLNDMKAAAMTFLNPERDAAIIKARQTICNGCPHKTAMNTCGVCGCPLYLRTRSNDATKRCPKGYW